MRVWCSGLRIAAAGALSAGLFVQQATAIDLSQAVSIALDSNPEIGQAIENRKAIEFELRQARGLFLPRVDLEARYGARKLDNPSRRAVNRENKRLYPGQVEGIASWTLFKGFARRAEVERQAARVDGASNRVYERSEFIALAVSKEYLEILLQTRILGIARENLRFHRRVASQISRGLSGGTYTKADNEQAKERVKAAQARIVEAQQAWQEARIKFFKLVAQPPSRLRRHPRLARTLPRSLDTAIGIARKSNPRIKLAKADLDSATALIKAAKSKYYPELFLEGRARAGEDLDGAERRTEDYRGRVVLKWNLYNGGIDKANEQEQIRRASEARMRLHTVQREVEEALRSAWNVRVRQRRLFPVLRDQQKAGKNVVSAYLEQFRAGRRTLLDVLSAQNTYINTRTLAETSYYAREFATYRILASTGKLVKALRLKHPRASKAYARKQAKVPPTPKAETQRRYSPDRSKNPWRTILIK